MDAHDLSPSLPRPDLCPPDLRRVLTRWQAGQATSAELVEASYAEALDLLPVYCRQSAPIPPEATASAASQAGYVKAVARVRAANESNRWWLGELLAWASRTNKGAMIVEAIQAVLNTHAQAGWV